MADKTDIVPIQERLRSAIIEFLPKDFWLAYSRTRTALHVGWKDSSRLANAGTSRPGELLRFEIPGFPNPIFVRSGSTDADIVEACLIRKYYAFLKPRRPVKFIIDAGANGGYSAVFFLEHYPDSVVVALEPDPDNFAIAQLNLEPYGNRCHLLKHAIWPSQTSLRLKRSNRHDSTQVSEGNEGGELCSSIDPLTILKMFNQERIHIFKCDIEGAEERLFLDDCDGWLERTDNVAIEIHGQKAEEIVFNSIRRHGFASDFDHNLYYFTKRSDSNHGARVS